MGPPVISRKGYGVFLDSISEKELKDLEKTLTVKPIMLNDYDTGEDKTFPVYRLSDTRIYLPRYFGINKYGKAEYKIKDGVETDLVFNGKLKDHQVDFCDRVLEQLKTNHSCIAVSQTGSGKTAMALWLVSQVKRRALIVVHKSFLLEQWKERIQTFLPNSTIGVIQQDKCEIDKDIVIGMIQTIVKREYDDETFKSFHLTIFDECHHLGAQVFSQTFFKIGSKMTLGLSANVKRIDGLTKVIEWSLGTIVKNEILSEIEKPTIKFVACEYSSNIVPKFNFKGHLNSQNMINQLVEDPRRNELIVDEIIKLNQEGRKILVLSGRRGHCEQIANKLIDADINARLYLGGMSNEELEISNQADVILGTYNMVAEAYDNVNLDTLVMATGMASVQQSIGRILRKKNKFHPLVIDFTDIEFFGGQTRARKQFYKKNGYKFIKETKNEEHSENEEETETESLLKQGVCLFD